LVWRVLAGLLMTAALLTGCGADADVDTQGSWLLVGASLPDGRWQEDDGGRYFLSIEGTSTYGTDACREFEATVEQDGDDLSFPDLETAERQGCPESLPDPLTGRFVTALEAIDSAERDDDTLILRGAGTTLTLQLRS
jgi:heat shock protein HslJ